MKKLERQTLANTNITPFNPTQSRDEMLTGTAHIILETDPANTGTIRFAVESTDPTDISAQYAVPAGEKVYITLNRSQRIYAQASAANQSFFPQY